MFRLSRPWFARYRNIFRLLYWLISKVSLNRQNKGSGRPFSDVRTALSAAGGSALPRIAAVLADLPHWPQEIKETCPLIGGIPTLGAKPGFKSAFLGLLESDGGEGSHATALALEPDVAIFDKAFVEPKIYAFLYN